MMKRSLSLIVAGLFVLAWLTTTARSLDNFSLSSDSASYISAAQNLITRGELVIYTNDILEDTSIGPSRYTEQPPGLPLLLVPFLVSIGSPVPAAAAAQVFILGLLFAGLYLLTKDLGMTQVFQMATVVAFALFKPLVQNYVTFWSENLFVALTFWAIHLMLESERAAHSRRTKIGSLIFATAASATRAIGFLSLPVFVAGALTHRKWPVRLLAALFATLLPMVFWTIRNLLKYQSASATHVFKLNWSNFSVPMMYFQDLFQRNGWLAAFGAVFAAGLCTAPLLMVWHKDAGQHHPAQPVRLKPSVLWGSITLAGIGLAFYGVTVDIFFGGSAGFGFRQLLFIGFGLLILFVGLASQVQNLRQALEDFHERYRLFSVQAPRRYAHYVIFLAALSHLPGIIVLSLVTPFSPLDGRLMGPGLALLLLSVMSGMSLLVSQITIRWLAAFVGYAGLFLLGISPLFFKSELGIRGILRNPAEEQAWLKLRTLPGIDQSTHFYSDNDYIHQVFALRPQIVIYTPEQIDSSEIIAELLSRGSCPFFLLNSSSPVERVLANQAEYFQLRKTSLADGKFQLYAPDCLYNGG